MVFESVLIQVLNRFLGDYVENVDTNQLNVGIWGGDVLLKDLVLKQSALDDLDLPVQTTYGRIGKLVLKIPWKNLYGSAIVINIEDIYLLAAPNQQVKYNPEKEAKRQREARKKEIKSIEEVKKQEAEKDKPKADYTFVEKLITQIIKNVQLNIKNIHIRYEDKITNPGKPFALGVTLSELDVVSTDENWKPAITTENISKIFKIVQLDGLSFYWNCNTAFYANLSVVDILHRLTSEIASKNSKPPNYRYILGPINASARLRLNQKPELDTPQAYTVPKVHLNLDMEKLFVGISKAQYRDIIALVDSMDFMSRGTPYRKFRPDVPSYKGHYREWWKFAYNCVLEGEVRRRRKNWDWNHIANHRAMCNEYREVYQKKLRNSVKGTDQQKLEECEQHLDMLNIVLIRQRVELETKRLEQVNRLAEKKSWLGWMWGSRPSQEQADIGSSAAIMKQFEEAMTPEEKARLYSAIDYSENASPAQYPVAYVDNSCTFILRTLEVELTDDDEKARRILLSELKGVRCKIETRAAASALKAHVKIEELVTTGLQQDDFIPNIICSETAGGDNSGLFEVTFEINPMDKPTGQLLHVTALPVRVVYDAQTVIKLIQVFKVPESSALDQLAAAYESSMSNFKEMSSTGLQHAIESHVHLDLNIDLQAPYLVLPYGGRYVENENVLVVNLGRIRLYSLERPEKRNVKNMHLQGVAEAEILKQMIAQSYDRFNLELTNVQVLVAQSTEDWKSCIKTGVTTDMHILSPVTLNIVYSKGLITDDPRLPHNKISGKLPQIEVTISSARLSLAMALATSIPLPDSEPQPLNVQKRASSSSFVLRYLDMQDKAKKTKDLLPSIAEDDRQSHSLEFVQFTTVQLEFVMSELSVIFKHQDSVDVPAVTLLSFGARQLECQLTQQTFNTAISLRLASVGLKHHRPSDEISILSTPSNGDLFEVKFVQVNKKSPDFHSVYKSCEARLDLEFATLAVELHQEGLAALLTYANTLQSELQDIAGSARERDRFATADSGGLRRQLSQISEEIGITSSRQPAKKSKRFVVPVVETVKFKLTAALQELSVRFTSDQGPIAAAAINGIHANVILKEPYIQVSANLKQIAVIDLNEQSVHKLILSVSGQEALAVTVVMYNNQDRVDTEKPDMSIEATMGGLKIVFLNWFVMRMLNFLDKFQTAQDAIIEASQAAAQSAKENVQNAYAKATKVALSINLKAPDIIVPANSRSYDAILLDLGHIAIGNQFLILDVKNDSGNAAVLDEMKMALTDFKLSRVKLDTKNEVVRELTLLEPISIKFTIRRNLSSGWYKAAPDMDISCKIASLSVTLSQMDYRIILSIVNGNLSEGATSKVKAASPAIVKPSTVFAKPSTTTVLSKIEEIPTVAGTARADVTIRFTFTMQKLVFALFTGGSKSLSVDSPAHERELRNSLGKFSMVGISIRGRLFTDNTIAMSFLLVNCLLDDVRPGREDKITRMMERTPDLPPTNESDLVSLSASTESNIAPRKNMIDVTTQIKGGDIFADVRVCSMTLILSVEFLMQISHFFTSGLEAMNAQQEQQAVAVVKMTAAKSTAGVTSTPTSVTPPDGQQSHLTLSLKIERPDIILVEHMDHADTNAMILNSEVLIKFRMNGDHQVINGSIKDLQVYTCVFNPARRQQTKSHALHPVTISLAGSTPANKGLHLELLVTPVKISVSPATIELLSRVHTTTTGAQESQKIADQELMDHSDIWNPVGYNAQDYWYLRADEAVEAIEAQSMLARAQSRKDNKNVDELCLISMPSIVVTVEAGVGSKTLPMIIMESSFKGNVRNWSQQLSVEAGLTLQMGYYNSWLALWEPLLEPIDVSTGAEKRFIPWELRVEVSMNDDEDEQLSPSSDTSDILSLRSRPQQPVMSIDVTSENNLELTVTKTCLEVLDNLGRAFSTAMHVKEVKIIEAASPYKVVNELGVSVTLLLERGSFDVYGNEEASEVRLGNGTEVNLQLKDIVPHSKSLHLTKELSSEGGNIRTYSLSVRIDDKDCDLDLPVTRADKRFFPLNYRGDEGDKWGLISDIRVDEGITVITLRSILQVYNHFNVPLEVYYMTSRGNELASITTVEPGATLNVPLKAVYTPTNELFFAVSGYSVTTTPYVWKDLQTSLTITKSLHCQPKDVKLGSKPFIIKAIGEMRQIYFENTSRRTMSSTCYNIHLRPSVVFKNCLPINVICCIENMVLELEVKSGESLSLPNLEPGSSCLVVRIGDYLGLEWSTRQEIAPEIEEFSVWTFASYNSQVKMTLSLGMHVMSQEGTTELTLYCPFWMLNKTGLMLGYRKSKKADKSAEKSPSQSSDDALNVLHHPPDFKGPILFSFNAKNFFGKKKAAVRVSEGEWSDKFSIDVAGSSGVVACKANDMIYQIGVHNQLTYNGLTKQITFTPYYVIINSASFLIECQESDRPADQWVEVEPTSCTALWPKSEKEDRLLKLRVGGTDDVSAQFLYSESHTTLLKLKNKYGGINVDIQITEGAIYICLTAYELGNAPALIVNNTPHTMNFWEKETVQIRKLPPNHKMLYTWENPSGPRILAWEGGNRKEYSNELRKDGGGEYQVADNYHVYWSSFLDGMQRVLLFTSQEEVAENAQAASLFEVIQQEINVSIKGVGLSLVNNYRRQEIMYMGIASSGVIWEYCKMDSHRFKHFGNKDSLMIETAYQKYLQDISVNGDERSDSIRIDGKTEINFSLGVMTRPHKRKIRRTFQTGLWIQLKSSPSQFQLHAKINRLQIDNQMIECVFPVVLAPVPPPKSVAASSGLKPFAELSVVRLLMHNSQVKQFKYFKLLVQEFHIKVDMGFITALTELFQAANKDEGEEKRLFLKDAELVDEPLYAHVSTQSLQEQKSFYDLLHFSPLKIHVSFSMAGGGTTSGVGVATPNFLKVLLQGLGVTLTDMQDVIFKLAYFEREYTFLTQKQLVSEAVNHYVGQSVKQLYVLVLGLDVLGNPYGLVLGITKGVEDLFYEPFQGAIQGPGEFAEGVVLGVRSLFGHTVGGAAGAVSRITGAMGKGIAALTFDDDYQRKRRDQLNKKPATMQEGLARSSKGLVMGVVDGVTGVFTKPISGAREEGVGGFFKGLGKGAVGLVTRPTAGVVDFASGSLDVVKRATEIGVEANRLRGPRFLQADGLVRPYNKRVTEGHKLLIDLEKGKYATTDIYVSHFPIVDKKEILILTDKRLAFVTHNDIFGGWQVDWSYTWQDLKHPTTIVPRGVCVSTQDMKKKKLGLFGSSDNGKIILVPDPQKREEICNQIESLRGSV